MLISNVPVFKFLFIYTSEDRCFWRVRRILPESVVWLYANNRVEDAERVIRNAAKLNNITLPRHILAARSVEIVVPPTTPKLASASKSNGRNGIATTAQKGDNGVAVLSNLDKLKEKADSIQRTRYTILDVFRSFRLALYCVCMSFLWSVTLLCYRVEKVL